MLKIIEHTPLWVWPLFLYLLLNGWRQMQPRDVPLWRAVALPVAMLLLSASRQFQGPVLLLSLFAWLMGIASGLNFCLVAGWPSGLRRVGQAVHVPGSALPLIAMLTIFGLRYVAGVLQARDPSLALALPMVGACSLVSGLVSSIFFARLVVVLRLVRRNPLAGAVPEAA
ncbi:MAG: hypothetical protein QM776_04075 [Rhodocyclaceae bacterium]